MFDCVMVSCTFTGDDDGPTRPLALRPDPDSRYTSSSPVAYHWHYVVRLRSVVSSRERCHRRERPAIGGAGGSLTPGRETVN